MDLTYNGYMINEVQLEGGPRETRDIVARRRTWNGRVVWCIFERGFLLDPTSGHWLLEYTSHDADANQHLCARTRFGDLPAAIAAYELHKRAGTL